MLKAETAGMSFSSGEFYESAPVRDRNGTLFQPDGIASDEFLEGFKRNTPLEPVLALIEDAVYCFQKYSGSNREKERRLSADAEAWFFSDHRGWPLSFLNVCDLLGLDPGYLRSGLMRWKEQKLAREFSADGNRWKNNISNKRGGESHGRKEKRNAHPRRRHPGGRQPRLDRRRRARAAAGSGLAAVRKERAR
jgi:hypothetical protein